MTEPDPEGQPKTQVAFSGGPPEPPKKTARGLADDEFQPDWSWSKVREAMEALAVVDERMARLVGLRFFERLTLSESADALGVSLRKAKNAWAFSRVWIQRYISES